MEEEGGRRPADERPVNVGQGGLGVGHQLGQADDLAPEE